MSSALVQLHLEHPFVQRILGRFLAQGVRAHDLSRVTIVQNPNDSLVRVIAFGRLSLFGPGAARLHDKLLSVAARWIEGKENELAPFAEEADRKALDMLETLLERSPTLDPIPDAARARVRAAAPQLFASLWKHIRADADAEAQDAIRRLGERGREESAALTDILRAQQLAIVEEIERRQQLKLDFTDGEKAQREQFEQDKKYLDARLVSTHIELKTEPKQIESLYEVALHRLEPVGLVVLWPETRG
jgi:hypothetical protein